MKRVIEFIETVEVVHHIIVDYDNEEDLTCAIEDSLTDEESCIEECIDELENSKGIYIDAIHTEWDSESQGLRYNDDYNYEEGF